MKVIYLENPMGKSHVYAALFIMTACHNEGAVKKNKLTPHPLQFNSSFQIPPKVSGSLKAAALRDVFLPRHKNEKKIDIVADEVPAKLFFKSLVKNTDYNIALHPKVEGKITLQLNQVTIVEVLKTVRNLYGFDYKCPSATHIEVLPASLQTRAFSINYLDLNRGGQSETSIASSSLINSNNASSSSGDSQNTSQQAVNAKVTTSSNSNFWGELKQTLEIMIGHEEGRKVALSPLAGLVVVQAMPDELRRVEDFLQNAELSLNRQVILEAKILEVELNKGYQSGINWVSLSKHIKASQLGGNVFGDSANSNSLPTGIRTVDSEGNALPSQINLNGPTNYNQDTHTDTGVFGGVFTLALNYKNLASFVELLSTQGNVQVLSSPRVSTTNNQKALIKVGTDEFFVTNVSSVNQSTNSNNNNNNSDNQSQNVSFHPFFSGIALDVTPHISSKGYVTLHIHPSISAVSDKDKTLTLNGKKQIYPLAVSNIRESDNVVRARNGQVVVIGGLMTDKISNIVAGVPILKDIPGLGHLFRHTKKGLSKSELVILLRPIIVGEEDSNTALEDSIERFQSLERLTNYE